MKQDSAQLRARISQYTDGRNITGLIDTLATLAELPVRTVTKLVEAESDETLVALGKACGIGWPDLKKPSLFSYRQMSHCRTSSVPYLKCTPVFRPPMQSVRFNSSERILREAQNGSENLSIPKIIVGRIDDVVQRKSAEALHTAETASIGGPPVNQRNHYARRE